jgi:glycosyltransferase involved in cell wall biosynthesis
VKSPAEPRVSICIPTYRRPTELRAAIDSCLAQTFQDFEIVVSDNSEDDDTRRTVESLGDARIRYFRNERNVGGVGNLALAASRARGEYLKLLMDDDVLKPRALERMVAALDANPKAGVAMAPLDIIDDGGRPIEPTFYLIRRMKTLYRYRAGDAVVPGLEILRDFMTRVYPCCVPSGLLYRRECFEKLGSFDTSLRFAVDVDICARFATRYDYVYLDEVLTSWRFSPKSDTVNLHGKGLRNEEFYELAHKFADDPEVMALFPETERAALRRKAYFFATKRCVLSILAGLRTGTASTIASALRLMWRRDPYRSNFLKLPLDLALEVARSMVSWVR